MKIPQQNLVFDIDCLKGTFKDWSVNNNDAAQSANSIVKGEFGWGSIPTLGTLSIPHDNSHNVREFSYMLFADFFRTQTSGDRLLYKAGAYDFYFSNATTFAYSDGSTAYTIPGSYNYVGAKTVGIRKSAGSSKSELWIDGVLAATAGGNNSVGSSSNPLYIGNALGVANQMDVPIFSAVMYGDASVDMTQLHKALISRKTPFKSKRNFYTAPSVGVPSSGSAWNAIVSKGQIIEQGPNQDNGTIYSDIAATQSAGLIPVETPWGEPALGNTKGTEAHINFGAAANVQYSGADTVFGYAQWFKCSSDGAQMLMSRSGNYFLQKISAGNLQLSMGSGAWTVTTSPVRDDVWHLYSFFVDEDYEYIYIDGEEVGKSARTGTPGGGTLRIGQYVITGFDIDGAIGPQVFYRSFSNLAEYQAELKKEWNRVANKVIYEETFSDAHIHNSDISSGPIPGTDWDVLSVGGRIVDGPDLGTKSITSSSAGNSIRTPGVTHTFGVIEIDCTPTSGTRCRHAFSSPGSFSILDVGDSSNGRIAYTTSVGGIVFATANLSSTTDRQTLRIEKKANLATNNTSLYKDGILLVAATGSNPCTDITNFTAERQITTYSGAQIHKITHRFGKTLP